MAQPHPVRRSWGLAVASANLVLLALAGAAAVLGQALDRASPAVEAAVRGYAGAMAAQDEAAALAQIAPSRRDEWRGWVQEQAGNIYEIKGLGVRTPRLVDRLAGRASAAPTEVSVVLDVNRGYPDFYYQATSQAAVVQEDGRWYLAEPLLAREVRAAASGD